MNIDQVYIHKLCCGNIIYYEIIAAILCRYGTWFPPGLEIRENLEKWEGIFQSGKSQGILLKILEKLEKITLENLKEYWKSQGNLSASNSENPANIVQYFK